ncbi:ABC transporter permease [Ramlibacter albus]|uniref:ABC transporter permease n=1 Tax=Ramlibacter albus TaxID=2079448 RepID=A0A923MBE7_9BURK|nr:ABC transporter permease [Ramlibacter albus]MBC5767116.1 ABC transporter permease [Ramlibacter albus]
MAPATRSALRFFGPAEGADETLPFWRREPGRRQWLLIACASLGAMFGLWWFATREGGWVPQLFLPPPREVWDAFVRLWSRPYLGSSLGEHVGASLRIVAGGWLLAGAIGLPLGIAMGWWKRVRWIAFPVFQLLRPVPPLAWIPLAILWLGIGDSARIFVVFIAAIVPWVLNSMQAVYSIDNLLVRAATTLGASDMQVLTRVVCRTALPTLVAGARIALGNAWTTLVAAELLAASAGLGYIAVNASRTLEVGILLVAMAIIGVLGALFSIGMQLLTRWVAPWAAAGAQS